MTINGQDTEFISIPSENIDPNPWQPRKSFDQANLQELAASISQDGLLQPLLVSRHPFLSERFFLIAGERRLRAARIAGLKHVPATVTRAGLDEDDQLRVALIENIQRSNLNVLEEGRAYRCLIERFGYTQEECAKRVGKDRVTVNNAIRILSLPEEVLEDLASSRLTSGHARALVALGERTRILDARAVILKRGLSVRETEAYCKSLKSPRPSTHQSKVNPDLLYLENLFSDLLGAQVRIQGTVNKGRIHLAYYSKDDLQRFLDIFKTNTPAT